jgi:hypothetical protein
MEKQPVSGFVMATERYVTILMTSQYSRREHKYMGPLLAVKGGAGYFAT